MGCVSLPVMDGTPCTTGMCMAASCI
jgi:hypothetical protein